MRSLIADAVIAAAGLLVRWMDPSVRDLHLTRVRAPLGDAFPLPALTDPCVPRGRVYLDAGAGMREVFV